MFALMSCSFQLLKITYIILLLYVASTYVNVFRSPRLVGYSLKTGHVAVE